MALPPTSKAPADWSPEEVHLLLNQSPWAKTITAEAEQPRIAVAEIMAGWAVAIIPVWRRWREPRRGRAWEAEAVRAAATRAAVQRHRAMGERGADSGSDEFANCYVISVIGFPLGGRRGDAGDGDQPKVCKGARERFRTASSLTPKGRDTTAASAAQVVGDALLLGFARNGLKLTPEDKEIAFATTLGRGAVKTKFNLKEMMYHETLAV